MGDNGRNLREASEIIRWFIDNDETNEGDTPMPDRGNRTWNEINAYWIEGLNRARAFLDRTTAELAAHNVETRLKNKESVDKPVKVF